MARRRRTWREWQHPRDDRGRFTAGRGSRAWAERALTRFGLANPGAMSMSAGPASSRGTKLPGNLAVGDEIEIPGTRTGIAPIRGRVKSPPLVRKGVDTVVKLEPTPGSRSNFQRQVYLRPDREVATTSAAQGAVRPGAPSGRIDLAKVLQENRAFHPLKPAPKLTRDVSPGKIEGMAATTPKPAIPRSKKQAQLLADIKGGRVVYSGLGGSFSGASGYTLQGRDGKIVNIPADDINRMQANGWLAPHDTRAQHAQVQLSDAGRQALTEYVRRAASTSPRR